MTDHETEQAAPAAQRPRRAELAHLQSARDVARLLQTSSGALTYALYRAEPDERYRTFEIPKRSGGARRIDAPIGVIREAQDALLNVLTDVIEPHPAANGFLPGRSTRSNAEPHIGARLVLNVDLKDFFPTINFGRVRGLFMAPPFGMGPAAATVCAQLCTFRNGLPQGAPTSPILSNFVAAGLDRSLARLARRSRMRYSRYADDLTFSTNAPQFPASVVIVDPIAAAEDVRAPARVEVGPTLEREIRQAGFEVNPAKVRVQGRHVRQSVTGVVVNAKANAPREKVRRIRAMIRAWRVFGLEAAGRAHLAKRSHETGGATGQRAAPDRVFRNALYGELAYLKMIRGHEDPIWRKFAGQLLELDPNPPKSLRRLAFGADDFDVFISHASEDKEAIARPIASACEAVGLKAFLDEAQIAWGDGFVAKINAALGAAPVVLAVVSDRSVTKEWPLAEMNTALQLEVEGEKTVVALLVGRPDLSRLPLMRRKTFSLWSGDAAAVAQDLAALRNAKAPRSEPAADDADDADDAPDDDETVGVAPSAPAPGAAEQSAETRAPAGADRAATADDAARPGLFGRLFGRKER